MASGPSSMIGSGSSGGPRWVNAASTRVWGGSLRQAPAGSKGEKRRLLAAAKIEAANGRRGRESLAVVGLTHVETEFPPKTPDPLAAPLSMTERPCASGGEKRSGDNDCSDVPAFVLALEDYGPMDSLGGLSGAKRFGGRKGKLMSDGDLSAELILSIDLEL